MKTTHAPLEQQQNGLKYHVVRLLLCSSISLQLVGCGDLGLTGSVQRDGVEKGKIANVYQPWEGDAQIQISNLQINDDGTFKFDCATSGNYGFLHVCVHLAGDPKPVTGYLMLSNYFLPGEKSGTVEGGKFATANFKNRLQNGCEIYLATGFSNEGGGLMKLSNSLTHGGVVATVPQPIPEHVLNPPSDELGLVPLPQDLELPAGTMLMKNNRGKYIGLTVVEDCAAGAKVKVKWDERPKFQPTYERGSLMINSLVLQDMRDNPFVIAKEPEPELVPLPAEELPFSGQIKAYVKVDGEFHPVLIYPSTIKDPSKMTFRSGVLKGKKITRSDIYITRWLLSELQDLNSRITDLVPLPRNKILPRGTELFDHANYEWKSAETVAWMPNDKYQIKYWKTNVTETVERSDLFIDRDLLASIPDPDTTVATTPQEDVELLLGTPCSLITPNGPLNARVVEQLANGQIKIELYSKSGAEAQLVNRSELRVPNAWLKFLATGGRSELLRPPLEKTPWFKIPNPPKFKAKAFLDLSSRSNRNLRQPFGTSPLNVLQDLEPGYYNMGGTDFFITGQAIQLNSNVVSNYKDYVGIPLDRKVNSLEILHSTMYGGYRQSGHRYHVDDGTVVGEFNFAYESGDNEKVPIVYGENVREWWSWEPSETKNAELVWTGDNMEAQNNGVRLRLYKFTLKNPHPEKQITHLIFESSMNTAVAPFFVAITVTD